jgi:hypothetical protein
MNWSRGIVFLPFKRPPHLDCPAGAEREDQERGLARAQNGSRFCAYDVVEPIPDFNNLFTRYSAVSN